MQLARVIQVKAIKNLEQYEQNFWAEPKSIPMHQHTTSQNTIRHTTAVQGCAH